MRVHVAAHQAAMIAAFLILLPGHIGAGEADHVFVPKMQLAALFDAPAREPAVTHRPDTSLIGKWRAVRERMRHEQRLVSLCRNDPAACPSDAATQFMAMVDAARLRDGRARVGEINRAVNLSVRPASDQKTYGMDVWTSPLATLASGQGDCEDYAIAKLAALWAAGIDESETRLVIVRDARAHEDHAIAMVRIEGRWLALDNRRFTLIEAEHLSYRPLYAFASDGIRTFSIDASWAELDDRGIAPGGVSSSSLGGTPILL